MGDVLHLPAAPTSTPVDVDRVCGQLETYATYRSRHSITDTAACMGIDQPTAARLETTIQTLLAALGGHT